MGFGKYGRCLGEIYVEEQDIMKINQEISVNKMLINRGHAKKVRRKTLKN
jgi:endonuclease YncB( thermonuclease family)